MIRGDQHALAKAHRIEHRPVLGEQFVDKVAQLPKLGIDDLPLRIAVTLFWTATTLKPGERCWSMGAPAKSMNASIPRRRKCWANTLVPVIRPCCIKPIASTRYSIA